MKHNLCEVGEVCCYFEKVRKRLDIEEALWTVLNTGLNFSPDAIKLYDFLARESYEGVNRERVYTFRMDFVLSRCMKVATWQIVQPLEASCCRAIAPRSH